MSFTYQVNNIGAGATAVLNPSGPNNVWTDNFYLSPTQSFNAATAILLGTQVYGGSLNAGASYQWTVSETLPNALSGSYYLIVVADSRNAVFELDQASKFGSSALQLSSKPADLVVSAPSAPASGSAGGSVLVNWTVTNQGTGDTAVTAWADNVYADTGSTSTLTPSYSASTRTPGCSMPALPIASRRVVPLPISLSGPYNLFVVTNEPVIATARLWRMTGRHSAQPPPVYESNFNNDTSAPAPISIVQNLADLRPTTVSAPTTVQAGGAATSNGR